MCMCFGHMSGAYRLNKLATKTLDPLYPTQRHGPSLLSQVVMRPHSSQERCYHTVKGVTPSLTAGPMLISWSM